MRAVTLTLSHPYNRMRERIRNRQWEGTTLREVGWPFRHCRVGESDGTDGTNEADGNHERG